jgi:hypothetical protein
MVELISLTEDIEQWVARVEAETVAPLLTDPRFPDASKMRDRFLKNVKVWRDGGQNRALVEDANEIAAAVAILELGPEEFLLEYEPRLKNTLKNIDFGLRWPDRKRSWVDVKTVAPKWIDDDASWQRFERIAADAPDDASLIVDRAWAGAAISGQEIKARWSFIQRAKELEEKIALLSDEEKGPVRLLLCSNGEFRDDGLEDFAEFYKSGRFRADDWSRNAVTKFLADRGITYARTIDGFCFLERRTWDARANEFRCDLRGPDVGR